MRRELQDTFDSSKNSGSRKPNTSPPLLSSFAVEITTPKFVSYSSITTSTPKPPIESTYQRTSFALFRERINHKRRELIRRWITQKKAQNNDNHLCVIFSSLLLRAIGKSLWTYKICWKWCPRAYIQAWTRLILFANTFCRFTFGNSLCTYKRCWEWCPRASIQAWIHLILFANTFCRIAFGKSLCTYKSCWKWRPRASIQVWTR
jgi:hypothetical protein